MDIRVACITCDKYSFLIPGFCHFIEKYWPDRPWPVDIITGTSQPYVVSAPYSKYYYGPDCGWASNTNQYLGQVAASAVILLLDDYYLREPVNTDALLQIAARMDEDRSIGYVNFRPWSDDVLSGREYREWLQMSNAPLLGSYDKKTAVYLLSLQPGIWRPTFLQSLLRHSEDGWQTEKQGTRRARTTPKQMLGCLWDFPMPHENVVRDGRYRIDGGNGRGFVVNELGEDHEVVRILDENLLGE